MCSGNVQREFPSPAFSFIYLLCWLFLCDTLCWEYRHKKETHLQIQQQPVMPWWRPPGTAFFSVRVKHLCFCLTVAYIHQCVHVLNNLVHVLTSQLGTKIKQNENSPSQFSLLACIGTPSLCVWVHVLKKSMEIMFPCVTCSCLRKSLSHTCQSLLHTQVSVSQMLIQKGFFCFVPTLASVRICMAECSLSVMCSGRGLEPFINQLSVKIHLG